jgi:hypothetical protein
MSVEVPGPQGEYLGGPVDIQKAWRKLAGGSPEAADVLMDVAKYGRSEIARVTAASRWLSIVGLGEKSEVNGTIRVIPQEFTEDDSAGEIPVSDQIRKRLAEQKAAFEQRHQEEMGIIDAEIVD